MLSTAFALICLAGCALCVFLVARTALRTEADAVAVTNTANKLRTALDRLTAVEGRLDRLAGRIYAQTRRPRTSELPLDQDEPEQPYAAAGATNGLDPDLVAQLALQQAPSAGPQSR